MMRYLESAITLRLDASLCDGCRRCVEVCPHGVLAMEARRARIADKGGCMECGACVKNCRRGALAVRAGVGCALALIGNVAAERDLTGPG